MTALKLCKILELSLHIAYCVAAAVLRLKLCINSDAIISNLMIGLTLQAWHVPGTGAESTAVQESEISSRSLVPGLGPCSGAGYEALRVHSANLVWQLICGEAAINLGLHLGKMPNTTECNMYVVSRVCFVLNIYLFMSTENSE